MSEFVEYQGLIDQWHWYGFKMVDIIIGKKFIGRAYANDPAKRRPQRGEPVRCWGGGVQYITWVRFFRRSWQVRTTDGTLRIVVEFPTSFIWSQIG